MSHETVRDDRAMGWFDSALLGLGVGAWITACGMGVQLAAWGGAHSLFREGLHHVSGVGALLLVATGTLVPAATRALGPRGPVIAWRAVTAAALALALCHAYSIDYFLTRAWSFLSYLGRMWELEPEYALVPMVGFVAGVALARRAIPSRRALRAQCLVAVVAAGIVLAAGAWRAARAPALERYADALPAVGTIPPFPRALRWTTGHDMDPSNAREVFPMGGRYVARYVFEARGQCHVRVAARLDDLPVTLAPSSFHWTPCDEATVRHDRANGLFVLQRWQWGRPHLTAFDLATGRAFPDLERGAVAVRGSISLPDAWLLDSALLLAVALALLALPSRAKRLLRASAAWRQGTLRVDRTVTLDDGSHFELPYGTTLVAGPVVVLAGAAARDGDAPFRSAALTAAPERDDIVQGTRRSLADALEASLDARLAWATATATIAAAPWLAAVATRMAP